MEQGAYTEALDRLRAAQRRAPHLVEVSFALGRVYLELDHDEAAKNELRRVVREAPQHPEAARAQGLLGQLEATTLPKEPDWSVGRLTEAQLLSRYGGEVHDPIQQDRLEAVIKRLRVGTPDLASRRFQVRILRSGVPNAWPIPPNKIFITQGLVRFIDASPELRELADDVLAFILGHEITHLIEHDTEKAGELQALAGRDVTDFQVRRAILHRVEYNADRRGALIAYQAQFDPFAAVMWCRSSQNRYGDSPERSDHPTYGQRETALRKFLLQELTEAHRQFKRGVTLLQEGDASRAAVAFEMYLAYLPVDTEAQYNLALAYFYQGIAMLQAPPWAPWELAKGIAMQPLFIEPHGRDITRAERLIQRAKTEVEQILRQNESHAASRRLLGDIALAYRNLSTAREHYQKALHFRPGDTPAQNNLGVLACLEARWGETRQQFQSCARKKTVTQDVARRNLEQLP